MNRLMRCVIALLAALSAAAATGNRVGSGATRRGKVGRAGSTGGGGSGRTSERPGAGKSLETAPESTL